MAEEQPLAPERPEVEQTRSKAKTSERDGTKKIIIDDLNKENRQEREDVEVEKSRRWERRQNYQNNVEEEVENFYQNKEFDRLQKPAVVKPRLWLTVFISLVCGLIAGGLAVFFIFTNSSVNLPWGKKIDLAKFLPTQETTLVTEKNVTVTNDLRLQKLSQDLFGQTLRIFKAKIIPENGQLSFLEQIYAPWQIIIQGVPVTGDGWLIGGGDLDGQTKYVALDNNNKIFVVEEIIQDPVTGVSFLKVAANEKLKPVGFVLIDEITPGRQILILDKFKNLHLTEVSQPEARDIYKTEDLVYSTDEFSDFLRLDFETSISNVPNSLIFGLDGKLIGLIVRERVIPAWYFAGKIDRILQDKKVSRVYLGIDYLRLEQAPGLTSPLFKDLANGAIVYGSPEENSPAAQAGVKNADVIIKVDDVVLNQDQNLTYLIQQKNPGEKVVLTILRDKEESTLEIELEEMKVDE